MKNKLIVWGLILATSIIALPAASFAASEKTNSITNYEYSATSAPQTRGRGRGRGRGRDDNTWNNGRRGRHHAKHRSHGTRTVRQVYYRNGRRYVRNVRVHY